MPPTMVRALGLLPARPLAAGLLAAGSVAAITYLRRQFVRRSSTRPTAIFFGPAIEFKDAVKDKLRTEWNMEALDPARAQEQLQGATALVGGLAAANDHLRASGPNLRLLNCHFTGVDWLDKSAVPQGVPVCNATGFEVPIAEWVIGTMLRQIDRINEEDASMRASLMAAAASGSDMGFAPPFFKQPPPPSRAELSGATVGIVGYGLIGKEIAHRAAAFGCTVIGTVGRAKPPRKPSELAWLGGGGDLHKLLSESDYVVLACPLTERTKGLVGAAELRIMKRGAYLVNIARGPVVDEAALYAALTDGTLAGAAIDVWWRLPNVAGGQRECAPYDLKAHPFHELPHVTLSPHTSGWTAAQFTRRQSIVARNLDAVAEGRNPSNVVYWGGS